MRCCSSCPTPFVGCVVSASWSPQRRCRACKPPPLGLATTPLPPHERKTRPGDLDGNPCVPPPVESPSWRLRERHWPLPSSTPRRLPPLQDRRVVVSSSDHANKGGSGKLLPFRACPSRSENNASCGCVDRSSCSMIFAPSTGQAGALVGRLLSQTKQVSQAFLLLFIYIFISAGQRIHFTNIVRFQQTTAEAVCETVCFFCDCVKTLHDVTNIRC